MKGFVFAIGSDDHPAALLNSNPIAAPLGEVKVVKLSLQLVGSIAIHLKTQMSFPMQFNISFQLDISDMPMKRIYCKEEWQEEYRELHDMHFTMLNCLYVKVFQRPNCSFLASSNVIDSKATTVDASMMNF